MKNYKDSDYALNKYSDGIVYRFADVIMEVSLADFLAENPGKTPADFEALKKFSDNDYLDQVRAENRQTKKNVSIHGMEESHDLGSVPLADEYIEASEREKAVIAYSLLMESGLLTETQERRFNLHIIGRLSLREIAERESVHFTSVDESIASAMKKFKKIFG